MKLKYKGDELAVSELSGQTISGTLATTSSIRNYGPSPLKSLPSNPERLKAGMADGRFNESEVAQMAALNYPSVDQHNKIVPWTAIGCRVQLRSENRTGVVVDARDGFFASSSGWIEIKMDSQATKLRCPIEDVFFLDTPTEPANIPHYAGAMRELPNRVTVSEEPVGNTVTFGEGADAKTYAAKSVEIGEGPIDATKFKPLRLDAKKLTMPIAAASTQRPALDANGDPVTLFGLPVMVTSEAPKMGDAIQGLAAFDAAVPAPPDAEPVPESEGDAMMRFFGGK